MEEVKSEDIKELTINGVLYAKYHMDGDVLFLKVIKYIIPKNEIQSENLLLTLSQA